MSGYKNCGCTRGGATPEITPSEPDLDNSSVGKRVNLDLSDAGQAVSPGGNGFFFETDLYIYSGCQKNVPLFKRFFLQPLIPAGMFL